MQILLNKLVMVVVIVGALNWGLIALNKFDLVTAITPGNPDIERIIKGVVGACALYYAYLQYQDWRANKSKTTNPITTMSISNYVTAI